MAQEAQTEPGQVMTEAQEPENQAGAEQEEEQYTEHMEEPGEDEQGEQDGESGEEQTEEETEDDDQPQPYSADEFAQLDPYDVDPARLPDAAREVHKRYMDIYTSQILPEIQQLRAFRDKVMHDIEQARAKQGGMSREAFAVEVRNRTKAALGVQELNDFDSEHNIELARQAAALQNELNAKGAPKPQSSEVPPEVRQIQRIRDELNAEMPDFAEVDRFAGAELKNMPYSRAQQILADMRSGDGVKIKAVYKMLAERYHKSIKAPAKKEPAPPTVMGGSTSAAKAKRASFEGWSGASSDDQVRMLVESGLLD